MKKKLKIIRVTTKPEALLILLRGQLKFINSFHNLIAISSDSKELKQVEKQEGIRVIPLNMTRQITPIKDIAALISMIKILKKERPDVVHSQTPKAGIISMLASIICGIPNRIHTVAGLPLMETSGIKKKILLFVEWLTYICATMVCPNSNGIKQYILKHISIPKKKLKVIGFGSSNGVDLEHFQRNDRVEKLSINFKKKFNLENKFSFIFIGRIVKDKGIEELLNAFVKLNSKFNDTRLIVLGYEEKNLDPISQNAKNILKSNNYIINLGFQSDIRLFLASSNCLVLPSYREGFPNVVLQASSMEVASIVSNINGCNEIIENESNGLLVKPKSIENLYLAMKKIYLDKNLCRSYAIQAKKKVTTRFSKNFVHNEMLSFYSNLTGKYNE